MRSIEDILNTLEKNDFPEDVIRSIAKINSEKLTRELFDSKKTRIYFFRYHFALGKTTYGLMNLTKGDIFLAETHSELIEAIGDFQKLRHDQCKRVVGWDTYIGFNYEYDKNGNRVLRKPTDDQLEEVPDEIRLLWHKEPKILREARKKTLNALKKGDKRRDGRAELRNKLFEDDEESELMERWQEQFRKEFWTNNVIFATFERIPQIKRRAWLGSTDIIAVDEGAEGTSEMEVFDLEKVHKILCDNTHTATVPNSGPKPQKRDRLEREYKNLLQPNQPQSKVPQTLNGWLQIDSKVSVPSLPDGSIISESNLEELMELTRKMYVHLYMKSVKGQPELEDWRTGITDLAYRLTGTFRRKNRIEEEHITKEEFRKRYLNIFGGNDLRILIEQIFDYDDWGSRKKLSTVKQLQNIQDVIDSLWQIKNSRIEFDREKNQTIEFNLHKPRMYDLWDIALDDNNNTEIWVLDATCGRNYLQNHLLPKYRYYREEYDRGNQGWRDSKGKFHASMKNIIGDIPTTWLGDGDNITEQKKKKLEIDTVNVSIKVKEKVECDLPSFIAKDKSYEGLDREELEPDYYRWNLSYDVEGEKETIPKGRLIDEDGVLQDIGKEIVRMLKEERLKKERIGVITNKKFAQKINELIPPFKDRNGNEVPVASWWEVIVGTNRYRGVFSLYSIGKPIPPPKATIKKYIRQYRELPEANPRQHPSMADTESGLTDYYDDAVHEAELAETGYIEEKSSYGWTSINTNWNDFFDRNYINPVYDSFFRMRYQKKLTEWLEDIISSGMTREIHRIGQDTKGFFGEADGTLSDLLNKKLSNQHLLKEWGDVDAYKLYKDREFNWGNEEHYDKLRSPFDQWKKLADGGEVEVSQTTLWRYRKKWDKLNLSDNS